MAEEQLADRAGGRSTSGSGFWKSLPGVVTAITGLVVAVTGLLAALGQMGWLVGGSEREGAAEHVASPTNEQTASAESLAPATPDGALASPDAAAASAPGAPGVPDAQPLGAFLVGPVSDGWAAVRAEPTVSSAMLSRLETGTQVRCGPRVPDATGVRDRHWRECPLVGGYIAARLLRRVRD